MDSRRPIPAVLLTVLAWFACSANAVADCDAEFAALGDASKYPDLDAKIGRWKSLASECGGTSSTTEPSRGKSCATN